MLRELIRRIFWVTVALIVLTVCVLIGIVWNTKAFKEVPKGLEDVWLFIKTGKGL